MCRLLAIVVLVCGLLASGRSQALAVERLATGLDVSLVASCFVNGNFGYVEGGLGILGV